MEKTVKTIIHLKTGESFETTYSENFDFSADTFKDESMLYFPVILYPLRKDTKATIFVPGSNISYIEVLDNDN